MSAKWFLNEYREKLEPHARLSPAPFLHPFLPPLCAFLLISLVLLVS